MPLSAREAFKVGFLARCAEEGCSAEEMHTRVAQAREKVGAFFWNMNPIDAAGRTAGAVGKLIGDLGRAGGTAAVVAPFGVGALGGYGAAKLTDVDETDADELKKRELIAEYKRLADRARRHREAKAYRDQRVSSRRMLI